MKKWSTGKLLNILKENEAYSYVFFGILTTLVNFISYVFFAKAAALDYKIAASLAWGLAVLFAFITNKFFVFNSRGRSFAATVKEFGSFLFFRILSYFVDLATIIILVERMCVFDAAAKLIASVVVAVLNYFASKYYIFCLKTKPNE
jgi:putative flippase GtrA